MLELILGIAGTGKTTLIIDKIKKRAQAEKPCLFLVPEQFSSSAETLIYQQLGDRYSAFVETVSFRTLAERIFKTCGGGSIPTLTDAGRVVFVRRALDTFGPKLATFSRHRRNAAFCGMCADTIHELKTAGATPEVLQTLSKNTEEPKFSEIALIYEAYEAAIEGAAADPEDRLVLAASKADCGYFDGKMCFIDNFDGFTAPEYRLLQQLIAYSEGVCVALCCDSLAETDGGLGLFSPVRKTAARLIALAQKTGKPARQPIRLQTLFRATTPVLDAVNRLVALREQPEAEQGCPGLYLTKAADEWEEVGLVAAEMRKLALSGVPYSRMAVVCRDLPAYESAVRRQFALYGIPYFTDAATTIEYTAPVAMLRAALALLRQGITSAPILALLKTGLCGYGEVEIAALENYVYTWMPKAAQWRLPFEKNPDGLLVEMSKEGQKQLEMAETLRRQIIPVLQEFVQKCKGKSAEGLSKQLYLLMDRLQVPEHLMAQAEVLEQKNELAATAFLRRAWDLAMELLDQMAGLLGAEQLSAPEYDDLFLLLVRATDVGQLPQAMECATFTEAGRMRLADPDYCFVLGVAEGEFPMQVGYSGLLTHADRDLLVEEGIELPGSFENRTLLEEMFLYRALTAAHRGLYLSWPARRAGVAKAMSAVLERLRAALQPPPLQAQLEQVAATPQAAFDWLGRLYRDNSTEAATLYTALETNPGKTGNAMLGMLHEVQNEGAFVVEDKSLLQQLTGQVMTLSATRAERFYECRFSYYLERILGVKPRRKAELSPLESGTFVHHILEQVLLEAGDGFASCTDEQLADMARRHADAFIEEFLPDPGRRAAYLLGQIKGAVADLLCHLRNGAAQSEFVIDAVELPIADTPGGVAPLVVETPDGQQVRVTGKIDRVDVLRKDGKTYLCIVDYKTGNKKFSLEDVYCGLNMQMMIYMQALCENGQERYPNAVPAGVLYLAGDPAPTSGARQGNNGATYKVDGLLLDDPDILRALDREGGGLFLPFKHKGGKAARGGSKLAGLAELGAMEKRVKQLLAEMADSVYRGDFAAKPLAKNDWRPCKYCPYRAACRHEDGRNEMAVQAPADAFKGSCGGGASHG